LSVDPRILLTALKKIVLSGDENIVHLPQCKVSNYDEQFRGKRNYFDYYR